MQQLSLWDIETDEHDIDISSSRERDILIDVRGWADGDTTPAQLERLALLSLGELVSGLTESGSVSPLLNYHLYPEVLRASRRRGYTRVFYRVISTAVIGQEVLCACEYLCTVDEFYGKSPSSQTDDEDLEDSYEVA